jgi:hypothetical protein
MSNVRLCKGGGQENGRSPADSSENIVKEQLLELPSALIGKKKNPPKLLRSGQIPVGVLLDLMFENLRDKRNRVFF